MVKKKQKPRAGEAMDPPAAARTPVSREALMGKIAPPATALHRVFTPAEWAQTTDPTTHRYTPVWDRITAETPVGKVIGVPSTDGGATYYERVNSQYGWQLYRGRPPSDGS